MYSWTIQDAQQAYERVTRRERVCYIKHNERIMCLCFVLILNYERALWLLNVGGSEAEYIYISGLQ